MTPNKTEGEGTRSRKREWIAYGAYALVALAIMLPLFKPGFILTLDMVFTPELRMPDSLTSSYLFHAGLHVLNIVIPSEIIQKILLFAVLVLAGVGMHRLVRLLQPKLKEGEWGIYFASIFFMVNPFTYSRFMAGQYAVLLGYALLPWFARLLLQFINRPQLKPALKLGGLATVISIVSVHTMVAVLVLSTIALGIVLWRYRQKMRAFLKFGLVAIGMFAVLSSYWLVPLAVGEGKTAETIQTFTAADAEAFATTGGNPAARLGNILRLQGFWAENRGQFLLPQDKAILWGLMALVVITLVVIGVVVLWRKSRMLAVFFAASAVAGMLLAAGLLSPLLQNVPLLAGLREPHKLVALVALSYGVFAAFGINAVLEWLREKAEIAYSLGAVAVLLLPFLFMRVMFWGFNGQLTPREYPKEWSTINDRLRNDAGNFSMLFLPWHQYMSFDFSGRIIANPAPAFFDKPVVVSSDPELGGVSGGAANEQEAAVTNILSAAKNRDDFAQKTGAQDIKYILLAKEVDYWNYDFLQNQPGLQKVADYPNATLYLNTEWREK